MLMSTTTTDATVAAPRPVKRSIRSQHPVIWTILTRGAYGIATLFVVSLLIFAATNILPGDVAQVVLGRGATPDTVANLQHRLGLDKSLPEQYLRWSGGLLRGDLGESAVGVAQKSPDPRVASMIGTPLRNSLILAAIAAALLVPLSMLVGVFAAVREGRPSDQITSYLTLVLGCLPEFVIGAMLILLFSTQLNWFPPVALIAPDQSPLSAPLAMVLPVATLVGAALAFAARQVRAGMVTALKQDYVLVARLNGIPESTVLRRYALRNALATTVQTYAQAIQYLFAGVIVVEALYAYPGIGTQLVKAVSTRDTPVVAGIALVLAAGYIVINIVADVLVTLLVPKLRTGLKK